MKALRALFVILLVAAGAPSRASSPAYRVIVNEAAPIAPVDRLFLKDAFLKKVVRWPNGEVIRPVDLAPAAPAREAFSQEVLRRSVAAVRAYWQQLIFSGRDLPPIELSDGDAVVRYVAKNRGAVGYVPATTKLEGVKELGVK